MRNDKTIGQWNNEEYLANRLHYIDFTGSVGSEIGGSSEFLNKAYQANCRLYCNLYKLC